ncbi:MAG: STAS domain-containing protein [Planctomycetes bacterium]|nr:STAS domain-containing protein [Planctomycetota bacterium]
MADTIRIPADFKAVVMTPPARVDSSTVPLLQQFAKQQKLDTFDGHRIMHLHQVESIDSSAVAGLLDVIKTAEKYGKQFLMCDPPPIVRSYLELYGAAGAVEGRVLSSANDGTYKSVLLNFVPPFVPNPQGRMDIYEKGKPRSYEFGPRGLKEIAPVDLGSHPPKAPTRASRMEVHEGNQRKEMKADGFVYVRKHNCGCGATHTTFDKLHQLHGWIKAKGFDFRDIELWASDIPAGIVTEKMTFRDRLHYEQFQTLLKIDSGWKSIEAPMEHLEEEYYYAY